MREKLAKEMERVKARREFREWVRILTNHYINQCDKFWKELNTAYFIAYLQDEDKEKEETT